jgi:hypothetical protein
MIEVRFKMHFNLYCVVRAVVLEDDTGEHFTIEGELKNKWQRFFRQFDVQCYTKDGLNVTEEEYDEQLEQEAIDSALNVYQYNRPDKFEPCEKRELAACHENFYWRDGEKEYVRD